MTDSPRLKGPCPHGPAAFRHPVREENGSAPEASAYRLSCATLVAQAKIGNGARATEDYGITHTGVYLHPYG